MTVVGDNTHTNGTGPGSKGKGIESEKIPIALLGKEQKYGDAAMKGLLPKYETVLASDSIEDILTKLPKCETTPRALFIGAGFDASEQSEVEKKVDELNIYTKVIKSQPVGEEIEKQMQKFEGLGDEEKVVAIIRAKLDAAQLE